MHHYWFLIFILKWSSKYAYSILIENVLIYEAIISVDFLEDDEW